MADEKISNMTAVVAVTGGMKFPLSDGTTTPKQATATQLADFIGARVTGGLVVLDLAQVPASDPGVPGALYRGALGALFISL